MPSGDCLDLWAITPELLLAGLAILMVPVAGWARGSWKKLPGVMAAGALVGSIALTARMLTWEPAAVFCDTYAIDGLANVSKLMIESGALITLILLFSYLGDHEQIAHAPLGITFATLGCLGLVSSLDLALIVLFLQMISLPSYLLVSMLRGDRVGNEATLKYFIFAATALAIMAYGLTFLFGMSGSLELRAIGQALQAADGLWVAVAGGIILIGYSFEITLVPFHFWAPDVYQGATAPIAGFLSVVPKIAGFAGLLRFLLLALPGGLAAWPLVMAGLSIVTMTLGNLTALRQTHMKRLLAYSSIAQAGIVLMAVAVSEQRPLALIAAGYYLAAYLFMNLGAFAAVAQVERAGGSDLIRSLRGLGQRSPGTAAVLALCLLSLAGIPPLAGFAGKVLVLDAVLDAGLTWLAVAGILNMVVSLYYYVAVVAEMYLHKVEQETPLPGGWGFSLSLGISLLGTLVLGVLPNPTVRLMELLSRLVGGLG